MTDPTTDATIRVPDIPPPASDPHPPKIPFPAGACDCHAHVFGPQSRYRLLPKTHFVPHETPLRAYLRMLRRLGCERGVLVQPSVYGTDNSLITEALDSHVFDLRAVAVVAADISDRELETMHAKGFRGIRINTASATPGLRLEDAPRLAERIKPLGWHLQFYLDLRVMPQIEEALARLDIDIVIDHFARISAAEGLDAPPYRALLRLLARDNVWAKLMGPYFVSDAVPHYPDIVPFARGMIATAPDRVVWGTDWPHPSAREKMPDDGDLADMLAEWAPDASARRKILVDNPRRLYGFD
jgi:predicted TIM-barrel fold metal-dependent hydrolase